MWRTLRAFAWMRWRVFVNSLHASAARDAVQRFSIALEHFGPILAGVIMVPSAIAFSALSGFAGYQVGAGVEPPIALALLGMVLVTALAFAVVGPVMTPVANAASPVRLLLLPIPVQTLYIAQVAGSLGDPWVALMVPVAIAFPLGVALGGSLSGALVAALAGGLFVVTLAALSTLVTTVMQLLLRNRRRSELFTLLFVVVLPMLSLLPAVLGNRRARGRRSVRIGTSWTAWVGDANMIAVALVSLVVVTGTVFLGGYYLFRRGLESPHTGGGSSGAPSQWWARRLPALSSGASAVALALVRLAVRSPRGRAVLITPIVMLVFFSLFAMRTGAFSIGAWQTQSGLLLVTGLSFLALIAPMPITLNQFGVDRAGLTLTLLAPLSTRQILAAKTAGAALIVLPPSLLCVMLGAAIFRSGAPSLWIAIGVAQVATFILASPFCAMLSILFPRDVDMNSIGSRSNAHAVASLVGLLVFAAAALPCLALVFVAARVFEQPRLAPLLLLLWMPIAFILARVAFVPAERLFEARRESFALLLK